MKKTLYTPLLTAALLLAASCANDPVEEVLNPSAPGTHLPGDTFIIDYAASTGEADTRTDANQRIQSLDYLVYQSTDGGTTYTLLKRRAIPDINTDTQWPLTRKTMTWAQREALKDTLNTSCMYKMVFVANAADWIWEKENATPPTNDALVNSSTIVLQNANLPADGTEAPKFEDGRLILPPRVFTEKDMYYMETVEVDGKSYAGEKTAYKNVLLKRMINKVKIELDKSIPTENVEDFISENVTTYYNSVLNPEEETGKIYKSLSDNLSSLSNGLSVGIDVIYANARDGIKAFIITTDFINGIISTDDELGNYLTTFKENLTNLYNKCNWGLATRVGIEYEENGYAQAINFKKETIPSTICLDPLVYDLTKPNEKESYSFTYYTFGNNTTGESNKLNQVKKYLFYGIENDVALIEISGEDLPINDLEGGNHYFFFYCNPLGIFDDTTTDYWKVDFNIIEKFGSNWNNDHFDFTGIGINVETLKKRLDNNSGYKNADEENPYIYENSTLDNIHLKVDYPIVNILPKWTKYGESE